MAVSVTPIKGHVHWDSQAQQWQVKASRQEKEGNKIRTFVKILEVFATLAEAIAFLVDRLYLHLAAGRVEALGGIGPSEGGNGRLVGGL